MTPKAQATTDKLDFIKIQNFCVVKDTINKVKSNLKNDIKYLQIIIWLRIFI